MEVVKHGHALAMDRLALTSLTFEELFILNISLLMYGLQEEILKSFGLYYQRLTSLVFAMVRWLHPAHSLYLFQSFFMYSALRRKITLAAAHLYKCVKLLSSHMFKALEIFVHQRTAKDVKPFT